MFCVCVCVCEKHVKSHAAAAKPEQKSVLHSVGKSMYNEGMRKRQREEEGSYSKLNHSKSICSDLIFILM